MKLEDDVQLDGCDYSNVYRHPRLRSRNRAGFSQDEVMDLMAGGETEIGRSG